MWQETERKRKREREGRTRGGPPRWPRWMSMFLGLRGGQAGPVPGCREQATCCLPLGPDDSSRVMGQQARRGLRAQGVAPCAIHPLSATSSPTLDAFLVPQLATVTLDGLQSDTSENSQSGARRVSKTKHTPGKRTHLSTNALLC